MNHRILLAALLVTALGVGTAYAQGRRHVSYGPGYGYHPGYSSTTVCTTYPTYPTYGYHPRPVYRHYPDRDYRFRVSIGYSGDYRRRSDHRRDRHDRPSYRWCDNHRRHCPPGCRDRGRGHGNWWRE